MTSPPATRSTNYDSDAPLGSTEPRLWTPPLRELTPDTSYGFDLIDFAADVCGTPFDPWQEWLSIHAGELLPDGRPRFRHVLVLVARQNGKSLWGHTLVKYWLFVERVPLVLGTSTDRTYAKRAWAKISEDSRNNPYLSRKLGPGAQRLTIGEEALTTLDGAEYFFAANSGRAARSTTLHRWLCDELREHRNRDAWNSASNAMNAVSDAQIVAVTNAGDEDSILIPALRDPAIEYIRHGTGDPRVGLFEWSAPPGAEPDDVAALAQANPNLTRRIDADALVASGRRAKAAGGTELSGFRTESMCQYVPLLDPAIEPDAWEACGTTAPVDLAEYRDKVALCLDISLTGDHATLVAAAVLEDGGTHVEVVESWAGPGCTKAVRADLPELVRKVKPRAFGWLPDGPAAALTAELKEQKGPRRTAWPPRGVKLEEIRAETAACCMAAADLVLTGEIIHPRDELLTAHVHAAQRQRRGDRWVFGRASSGAIDGAYAMAGAVQLARTLPPAPPPLTVL
ncbi:terminase [Haloechinothrix salitolerans]|uniref:Terminase n=1 Tax=Haloechinothrix salitolerans TaxID=926830 RepID=A0ABW2BZ77_9PSEU